MMKATVIPIDLIDEPENAHRIDIDPDDLVSLSDSIREHGILQPIIVRQTGERYEIIAGHRRFLASVLAHITHIPAMIAIDGDAAQTDVIRAVENLQRANLTPVEEARICWQLHTERGIEVDEIAHRVGRSRAWVETRLQIAALPDDLINDLHSKTLPISHALLLGQITDEKHRKYLHEFARRDGVTVNVLSHWVSTWHVEQAQAPEQPPTLPAMPGEGQLADVSIPCGLCGNYVDYRQTGLVRLCPNCGPIVEMGLDRICEVCRETAE